MHVPPPGTKPCLPPVAAAVLAVIATSAAVAAGAEPAGAQVPFPSSTDRLIVKLKAADTAAAASHSDGVAGLSVSAGLPLTLHHPMTNGIQVVSLPRAYSNAEAAQIAARIARDAGVEYAEPDYRRFPQQAYVSDPLYASQWPLFEPAGGAMIEGAWAMGFQGQGVTVAVIDTGILPHPDITARFPSGSVLGVDLGYDFISDPTVANDGDGRDPDPTDPGNWVSAAEAAVAGSPLYGCPVQASDWHGTHTAGVIGASANNGIGIAGVAFQATIVPLRALGKCGGYTSDIVDAMRWAAGLAVTDPAGPNPHAAQVLNLSLSGPGPCGQTEQAAIDEILAGGTVRAIVVAAGNNSGTDVSQIAPAGCQGVIAVAATTRTGALTDYSNVGAGVTLSAPGGFYGASLSDDGGILSLFDAGTTSPLLPPNPTSDYAYFSGTSESAAIVSGVVALMLSANPGLTSTEVATYLTGSARGFPDCSCSTSSCGAGIVDAEAAVASARNLVVVSGPSGATCPASATLGGVVFVDSNGNGVQDPGERGLAGVTVQLKSALGAHIAQRVTDANGAYAFENARPLTYSVSPLQPAGYQIGTGSVGSAGGVAAAAAVSGIALVAGTSAQGYNFPASGSGDAAAAGGGGAGGGGGGCTLSVDPTRDPLFPLLLVSAATSIVRRRRR